MWVLLCLEQKRPSTRYLWLTARIKVSTTVLDPTYSTATYVHVEQASQELYFLGTDLETIARSPPTSQTSSSFEDCLGSQLSGVRPDAAGHADLVRLHDTMILSSSFSNKSSEESTDRPYLVEPDASTRDHNEIVDGPIAEGALDRDHTSATKRTANGETKTLESGLPTSPLELSRYRHSRKSSKMSGIPQIGEVRHVRHLAIRFL